MGINEELCLGNLSHEGKDDFVLNIYQRIFGYPTVVARALLLGCDEIDYKAIFKALKDGKFAKEAVEEIVERACGGENIDDLIQNFSTEVDVDAVIDKIIKEKKELIEERGEMAFKPLMGLVMKELRGKVDGKIIAEKLKVALKEHLEKNK
ncbi:hypothetical protein ABOONEI_571 [Aciduliprofundum boonei T469]|nr:hypothetical protein ABOONEI_571 [Aciduliprofundum boonei T469]